MTRPPTDSALNPATDPNPPSHPRDLSDRDPNGMNDPRGPSHPRDPNDPRGLGELGDPPGLSGSVRAALAAGGPERVLQLARTARGPVVEPTADPEAYDVTFVFADRGRPARAVGLFCAAVPSGFARLSALGAGVFAQTFPLPRGTRVKYHFAPDPPDDLDGDALFRLAHSPTARRIDRLNPHVDQVHIRGLRVRMLDSLLTLPGARTGPPATAGGPAGTVETLTLPSAALGRRKDVVVHLPAGYEPDRGRYPLVLLLEGNEEWRDPAFLDGLAATGLVQPFVAVRFDDRRFTARLRDLNGGPAHTRFVLDELLPELARRHAVSTVDMTVAGYSAGGLALDEPDRFGRLAIVSGALHLTAEMDVRRADGGSTRLLDRYAAATAVPKQVYLAAGMYEDIWLSDIDRQTRALAECLRERGATVRFDTGPTGHDTRSARAYLADGLAWLLPPR